jgi:aspartyl-tRNA(Asn)/glutamyl-tRNA(Gln) amidotransferase subunit C
MFKVCLQHLSHLSQSYRHLPLILYFCLMEVNETMVDKLANLARLQFDDAEKQSIKTDLQKMIQFVEKLNELDTTGVQPMLHMSSNINVLREDEVKGSIETNEGLKNAPKHDGTFFKVPKVIVK